MQGGRRREHLRIEELVVVLGTDRMITLARLFPGRRLPSERRLLGWLRYRALVADWLHGYSHSDLAARYRVSRATVRRFITRFDRARRREAIPSP